VLVHAEPSPARGQRCTINQLASEGNVERSLPLRDPGGLALGHSDVDAFVRALCGLRPHTLLAGGTAFRWGTSSSSKGHEIQSVSTQHP